MHIITNTMNRFCRAAIIFLMCILVTGCKGKSDPDIEPEKDEGSLRAYSEETETSKVKMSESTIFVTGDIKDDLQNFDVESGAITFADSDQLSLQEIKVGDILYSTDRTEKTPDGYCLRVVSIDDSGDSITYQTEPATALEAIDYLNESGVLSAGNYRQEDIRIFGLPEDDDIPGTKSGSVSIGGFSIGSEGVEIKGDKLDFFSDTKVTRFGYILYEHKEPGDDLNASFKIKLTLEMQHELDTDKSNVMLDAGNFVLFTMFTIGVSAKLEIGTTLALEKNQDSLLSKEQERMAKERLLGKKFKIAEIPLNFTCSKIIVDPKLILYGEFKLDVSGKMVLEAGIKDGTYAFNLANNGSFSTDFETNSYLRGVTRFSPFINLEGRIGFSAMAGWGLGLIFEIPSMPVITEDDGSIAGKRKEPSGIGLYFGAELTADINVIFSADFFSGNREFRVEGRNGALKLKASIEGKVGLRKKVWGKLDWTFWEKEMITLPDWDWTWSVWTPTPYDLESTVNDDNATVALSWKVPDGKGVFNKSAVNIGTVVSDKVSLSPFVGNLDGHSTTFGPAADGTYYWNVTTQAADGGVFPSDTCSFVINASKVTTGWPEIKGNAIIVPVEINTRNNVLDRGVVYSTLTSEPIAGVDKVCHYIGSDNSFNLEMTDYEFYLRGYALISLVDGGTRYIYGNTVSKIENELTITPEELVFNDVPVGRRKTLSLTIINNGTDAAFVKVVPQYDGLPIINDWSERVFEVGDRATLNITYAPEKIYEAWTRSITLNVYDGEGQFITRRNVKLSGSSTSMDEAPIELTVSPEELLFDDVSVGHVKTLPLVIVNSGTKAGLVKVVPQYDNIPITFDWSERVFDAGRRAILNVTYAPEQIREAWTSSISLDTYDKEGQFINRRSVKLSGSSSSIAPQGPNLSVSTTKIEFDNTGVGKTSQLDWTITNVGNAQLDVSSLTVPAGFSTDFSNWSPKSLAAGESHTFKIFFNPTEAKTYSGKLVLKSNAVNTPEASFTIGGIGTLATVSVTSVSLNKSSLDLTVGGTATLIATVLPDNADNKRVTWTSSKPSVATVSSSGVVTAVAEGSAVITVTTSDGGYTASCNVTVKNSAPEPKLSVSTKRLDFGNQIKFTQESKNITITNSGTGTLQITSISKTNNYGDLFQLSGWTSGGSIAAGASKTVTVSFQPLEERTYEETLTIVSSNAVGDKRVTVTLVGTGAPEPENAVIQISGDNLSWGDVELGESVTKSFSVKNTGTTALNISSVKVVATDNTVNPSYFTISPNSSCTVSPGKTMTFNVTFSPESVRNYSAVVSIKSNAGNASQGTSTVTLSGSGIKATSRVLSASPSSLSFGSQTVGNRTHRNFTIYNRGTKAVTLYSMVASDGFYLGDAWSPGSNLSMAAGSSKTFSIAFAPTQLRSYTGNITITSNAAGGDLVIPLSGTGVEAQGYLEIVSGDNLDFGNVSIGASGSLYTKITNTEEAPLKILGFTCPEGFSAQCNNSPLIEGAIGSIAVSFSPTQAKYYSGYVIVHTDAENENVTIYVQGTGKQSSNSTTFVDMGVSVKWASTNVGAALPEDFGHYVAWGETAIKTQYLYDNYKFYVGPRSSGRFITKYCPNPDYGYQGYHDNLSRLELEDYYANIKLGGRARIPTKNDWLELKKNSTWQWTSQDGVNGYLVTSTINGNTIFLPAGGKIESRNDDVNTVGYYWTSDLDRENNYAHTWELRENKAGSDYRDRCIGMLIRAVEEYDNSISGNIEGTEEDEW